MGHGGSGKILGTQSRNHTTTDSGGALSSAKESRNKSYACLRIHIINNNLNNYVVFINNVYINKYLNIEHTTNKIVRIRVKMYWVLYY